VKYPTRLLSTDEEVVRQFRPHWQVLIVPMAITLVLVALVVSAFIWLETDVAWIVTAVAALLWFVLNTRRLLTWLTTQHVITNERVVFRAGILSRRGKEIPLEVINDVAFSQTILERIVRSGDLLIESAGELGQSRYSDIPDPEAMQSLIYTLREKRILALQGGGKPSVAAEIESLAELRDRGIITGEQFEARRDKLIHGD